MGRFTRNRNLSWRRRSGWVRPRRISPVGLKRYTMFPGVYGEFEPMDAVEQAARLAGAKPIFDTFAIIHAEREPLGFWSPPRYSGPQQVRGLGTSTEDMDG